MSQFTPQGYRQLSEQAEVGCAYCKGTGVAWYIQTPRLLAHDLLSTTTHSTDLPQHQIEGVCACILEREA